MRDGQPPDLEMRVRTTAEHGKTRLSFILSSPSGEVPFAHREIDGPLLQRKPDEYQAHLLGQIEKLGEGRDIDRSLLLQDEVESKLESLGRDLWRELFPAELRSAYRDVIRSAVHSWVIVSDEPWIPWELVKPYDDGGPGEPLDDEFLCLRFELTRWLAGERPFVPEITVRSLAVVESASDLPHAPRERKLFSKLKEEFPGLSSDVPPLESAAEFLGFLTWTGAGLIHLIGHGTPMTTHPDESGLPFPDRSVLRPSDLHGPLATHLGRRRPMVLLNACWAGREGWSLTRLGGWAARWIGRCGCSAFVAPLWPVRDEAAVSFAWAFYEALAQGETLGQAALQARQHVRQEHPGDPSALAYTIYGHPNARVLFRDAPAAEEAPQKAEAPRARPSGWARPRRRRRPRWLWAEAAVLGLAVILHFAAPAFLERWFPMDQPPAAALKLPERQPSTRSGTASAQPRSSTATTQVGGLTFKVSGGQSSVQYRMKEALRQAAAPLVEEGVSGWTISVQLKDSEITPVPQGTRTMQSCRLIGNASARGPASPFDLGPVEGVSAQFTVSKACEAAARPLAEVVVKRFISSLPQEGEP